MPSSLPERIGPYEIVRLLGRGGMGVVYEVREKGSATHLALKLLQKTEEHLVERFQREARTMQLLSEHEHIVRMHATGEVDGKPYIVMELCPGGALSDRYHERTLPEREAAGLLVPVVRAVHFIHEMGIIHRDLKPQNVLFDLQGRPKVTDLGIAKNFRDDSLTATGTAFGTPTYMAPEQALGAAEIDRRADIWALGAILFKLVSGRTPFQGKTDVIARQLVQATAPSIRSIDRTLSRDLDAICARALARDRARRYETAEAFAQDLELLARGERPVWAHGGGAGARSAGERAILALAVIAIVASIFVLARGRGRAGGDGTSDGAGEAATLRARIAGLEAEAAGLRPAAIARPAVDALMGASLDATAERELAGAKSPVDRARALVAAAKRTLGATPTRESLERAASIVEAALALDSVALVVDLEKERRHEAGAILVDAASPLLLAREEPTAEALKVARGRLVRGRVLGARERSTAAEARALGRLFLSRRADVQVAARPWCSGSAASRDAFERFSASTFEAWRFHGGAAPPEVLDLGKALDGESPVDARRKRDCWLDALLERPDCAAVWIRVHLESISMGDFALAFRCAQEAALMDGAGYMHERLGDAYLCLGRFDKAVVELEKSRRDERTPWRAYLLATAYMGLNKLEAAKDLLPEIAMSSDANLQKGSAALADRIERASKE